MRERSMPLTGMDLFVMHGEFVLVRTLKAAVGAILC